MLIKRIKSLIWRAGGMAFITAVAYITQVGDIFSLDYKMLINLSVLAFLGLVTGEITKYLNTEKTTIGGGNILPREQGGGVKIK